MVHPLKVVRHGLWKNCRLLAFCVLGPDSCAAPKPKITSGKSTHWPIGACDQKNDLRSKKPVVCKDYH